MTQESVRVITIPAKPQAVISQSVPRQLRVAAYCRVSTNDKDQISSYKAQKNYYTDYIMKNPEWTLVGIFADEGVTGTQTKRREGFLQLMKLCKQKKVDLILVKSISRFARNTVDCLKYTRSLRALGIGVYFEEQNINSLSPDSEFLITLHGAIAQNESENMSKNIVWGKRQAMREGRAIIQYKKLYAYEKGEDGKPQPIPEQAAVVREIYRRYLAGATLQAIQDWLNQQKIPDASGRPTWTLSTVRNILTNEKYCGDVLLQKTFIQDCISKKVVKNTGQLPMYLIQNHHEAIVDRKTYDAVQAEVIRRRSGKSPSKKHSATGQSHYSSKYALTERLICGECGTLYRRCTWAKRGKKRVVWRCTSRLDYGTKYCHNSPTMDEAQLQRTILAALNSAMSQKDKLIQEITGAMKMELSPIPGETMSLADIEQRLEDISKETRSIVIRTSSGGNFDDYAESLKAMVDEAAALKEKRSLIQCQQKSNEEVSRRIEAATAIMEAASPDIAEWDESTIRQLVETVKVLSAERIEVYLRGGAKITQDMIV